MLSKNFNIKIVWKIGNHASSHSVSIPNLMQLKSIYLPFPSLRWEKFVWFELVAAAWRKTMFTWTGFCFFCFTFLFKSNYIHFWDHHHLPLLIFSQFFFVSSIDDNLKRHSIGVKLTELIVQYDYLSVEISKFLDPLLFQYFEMFPELFRFLLELFFFVFFSR